MSKKLKYILSAILSLMILSGCDKNESEAETSETSASETSVVSEVSAAAETFAEITAASEENSESGQEKLEKVILKAVAAAGDYEENSDVHPLLFGDLDGDGKSELIALYGWSWESSEDITYLSGSFGDIWFASGDTAVQLFDRTYLSGIDVNRIDEVVSAENIGGHTILKIDNKKQLYDHESDGVYFFEISGSSPRELDISGKFIEVTDVGNGAFTAKIEAYDEYDDYSGYTHKLYWFYFEDGEFKEYIGEKITKADFMKYSGGKAAIDKIEAEGGNITGIIYRKNNIVNINYTAKSDYSDDIVNKFLTFDVSGEDCAEVKNYFRGTESNLGIYLLSALDPFYGLPEEQLALHKLILDTADTDKEYNILTPKFGDFDGDGKNELIAVLGEVDDSFGDIGSGEVWFAAGDKAECIASSGHWLAPKIVTSCGRTFIKMENCAYTTSSISAYFLLKDSAASEYHGVPGGQGVYPDGEFGDFTAIHDAYDMSSDGTGHTWKTYWYYIMGEEVYYYHGRIISEEDFLKYNGAKAVLDELAKDGETVTEIIKRGNGIITVNLKKSYEKKSSEDFESYSNKNFKYRNGKLFDITENYDDGGNYWYNEDTEQTDFERFCEMIFDTAEGDENSRIRERFFGDFNADGKNELYAYYGTDEKFSLWFADENGAKAASETEAGKSAELFIADGDTLLKISRSEKQPDILEYYIIQNGKSKRLDNFGAKRLLRSENGDFTGFISAEDTYSDNTVKTEKEYWFYYKNGAFHDYTAKEITEEQLAEYKGARAALDEITSMGGEVVSILQRENGIININYDSHRQDLTLHYYLTLKIDDKGRAENITPKKDDGTLDNSGYYLRSLT